MFINRLKELIENEKNYIENVSNKIDNSEKKHQTIQEMSKDAKKMKSLLNCNCKYYPLNSEDSDIIYGYIESLIRSKTEKFIPVIVDVSSYLIEDIIMNIIIDIENDYESIMDLDMKKIEKRDEFLKKGIIDFGTGKDIEKYRKNMISKDFSGGKDILSDMIKNNRDYFGGYELEKDELDAEDNLNIEINDIDFENKIENQGEILIAEIPVENSWEIFAYIPFGGWNDCPGNEAIMSISKYWFEKYKAIPFLIGHNTLEYIVKNNIDNEDIVKLIEEFYAFCPDSVDKYMGRLNLDKLAKKIYKSKVWCFCWN